MTKEEIIEMARQAGFLDYELDDGTTDACDKRYEAFARLVAEHERYACAKVCDEHAKVYASLDQNPTTKSAWAACIDNRDAIRVRGQE